MRGVALPLLVALAAPAAAAPVRMFAVGHKVRVDDALTYQSFHDKMAALMDAAFPGRATLVQAGVEHGVYPAASVNGAPARRVEQATDPGLVALLRDPDEPSRARRAASRTCRRTCPGWRTSTPA